MARYNIGLSTKFDAALSAAVERAYAEVQQMSACAGINTDVKGTVEDANKAIYNNEDRVLRYPNGKEVFVAARPWLDYATGTGTGHSEFTKELRELIKQNISTAKVRKAGPAFRAGGRTVHIGNYDYVFGHQENTGQRRGPKLLMQRVAIKMAENQKTAIQQKILRPNEESTKRRKRGDTPMVWTKDMLNAISAFVELY